MSLPTIPSTERISSEGRVTINTVILRDSPKFHEASSASCGRGTKGIMRALGPTRWGRSMRDSLEGSGTELISTNPGNASVKKDDRLH